MGDTPTSPVKDFALATLFWLSPIRRPRLWKTLIGAMFRPYGAGTPESERLRPLGSGRFLEIALGWGQVPALHFLPSLSAYEYGSANSRFGEAPSGSIGAPIPERNPGHAFAAIGLTGWRRHAKIWRLVPPPYLPWIPTSEGITISLRGTHKRMKMVGRRVFAYCMAVLPHPSPSGFRPSPE